MPREQSTTVLVLDRPGGPRPPYPEWLRDAGRDLVLLTGRPGDGGGRPEGYAEAWFLPAYATSAEAELRALDLARRTRVGAIVAIDPADLVRAAGLRDLLDLPGQRKESALAFADSVRTGELLRRAGVPVVHREQVRRVADVYWHAHAWGYPLRIRQRREHGRPVVAELRDEAEARACVAAPLITDPEAVPSLTVERLVRGERHRVLGTVDARGGWRLSTADGSAHPELTSVARSALTALPAAPGYPYLVEVLRTDRGEWLVDTVTDAGAVAGAGHTALRALVRQQAGLDVPSETEPETQSESEPELEKVAP